MCGIAGLMTRDGTPPPSAVLDALAGALAHRGPDGRGHYVHGGVGLVHTRLAIIDLTTGDQPLFAPDGRGGRLALVANGEVYNFVELRAALPGAAFATRSDCEPPLYLYARDGLGFADALRGMYALALHDPAAGRLVLARDPFGIKPLYWAETAAGFAFASEPQALLAAGLVAPRVVPARRDELFQLRFGTGAATLFDGIHRVLPGETLVVEKGRVVDRRRRPALPAGGPVDGDADEALARLDAALVDSVDVHQRSDVPYGLFLSGGIDSAALLALMGKLNDAPVHAFTAGFPGTAAPDERDQAARVAAAAGARHETVEVTEADFWTLLPRLAAVLDDPVADYAVLPTFKLAGLARERGLKVILSGEGGDEMFGGYGRYRRAGRWRLLGGRPLYERGAFEGLGVLRGPAAGWRAGLAAAEAVAAGGGRTGFQSAQAVDCAAWLPNDLLTKLDRCLMARGVEGRTPFLDPRVAEVAFRLPDRLKARGRLGKWLLRRWLADRLPESDPFGRKRGFTVPVAEWIAARGPALGPLVAAQPGIAESCHPDAVVRLFRSAGKREGLAAWTLLFYALWHRAHVERQGVAECGVFEALAARP